MAASERLITKAITDADFRRRLMSDPRETLERETGKPVPPDMEVTVLEETRRHAYIVLPPQQSELSQEELAAVAGGAGLGCMNLFFTKYCTVS